METTATPFQDPTNWLTSTVGDQAGIGARTIGVVITTNTMKEPIINILVKIACNAI